MLNRRRFLEVAGALVAGGAAGGARVLAAQDARGAQRTSPGGQAPSGAANVPMDPGAYREVRRAPKAGAAARLTTAERDELEHRLGCACPCSLSIYTCRTTDFSCGISPQMHRDVLQLVEGGYSADEIIAAFVDTYGESVLMAPTKEGFNLVGYAMPFAAIAVGAVAIGALIRRWRQAEQAAGRAAAMPTSVAPAAATDDELARLDAAVRNDA